MNHELGGGGENLLERRAKLKQKRLLTLIGSVCLILVLAALLIPGCAKAPAPGAAPAPAAEVIKWRLVTFWGTGTPFYPSIEAACDRITTASGGRLVVECFPGGAICPATKEFDAVNAGTVEAARSGGHYLLYLFPAAGLFGIVVAGPSPLERLCWYYEGGGRELETRMMEGYNVRTIAYATLARAEMFGHSNKPLTSLADFKGLKFRTAGDWGSILTKLGASVVFLPGGEIYEAAQRGVIDAFEYSTPSTNWSMGFHEICKYAIFPGIHAPNASDQYLGNKDAWAKLAPDLQVLVEEILMNEQLHFYSVQAMMDMEAIQNFKDYGTEIIYLPEEVQKAVEEAAKEYYDELAAEDAFVAEVLQSQREFSKSYRELQSLQYPYYVK